MYLIIRLKDSAPHFAELKELYPNNGDENATRFYLCGGMRYMVENTGDSPLMFDSTIIEGKTHTSIYCWNADGEETWIDIDYIDMFYTDKHNPFHDKYER